MATEFKLSFTANEINLKLGEIDNLAKRSELPTKTSELTNDSDFATVSQVQDYVQDYAQPKGDYALKSDIKETDLSDYALKSEIPTDYLAEIPEEYVTDSELNEKGYLTEHQSLEGLATQEYVDEGLATKQPIGDYALKSELPSPIIDVVELPTENIQVDCFYRLMTGTFYRYDYMSAFICHVVDGLPDAGEPMTFDGINMVGYYNVQDSIVSFYADDVIAANYGLSVGWYTADVIFEMMGAVWGGVITDVNDATGDAVYLITEHVVYHYKNAWIVTKGIGWHGEGNCAEIFNSIRNTASGEYSHAEGYMNNAAGECSHAEGSETAASGDNSHAEGIFSNATGDNSHAEGYASHAVGRSQHVQGEYNVVDPEYNADSPNQRAKYAHIVGNGESDSTRSNAHTLDWDGNAWFQGEVYVGGTGQDDENAVRLAKMSDVPEDKVFIAERDVTKYAEVKAAHDAGKMCFLNYTGYYYPLIWIFDTYALFSSTNFDYTLDVFHTKDCYIFNLEHPDAPNNLEEYRYENSYAGSAPTVSENNNGAFMQVVDGRWTAVQNPEGLASTSYVDTAVASLVNSAPEALNTLDELAAALGDDENFATTVTNQIAAKLDTSELPTAIDTALAQAKESGEFDGADGEDGYSPVRGTDYWTDADKAEIKSYVDEAILGGVW